MPTVWIGVVVGSVTIVVLYGALGALALALVLAAVLMGIAMSVRGRRAPRVPGPP